MIAKQVRNNDSNKVKIRHSRIFRGMVQITGFYGMEIKQMVVSACKTVRNAWDYAINGFKLWIYWCLWILSATITVTSCAIPASSKSACKVFSFWVLRPAIQKLSLKWLIDFSTFTRILYGHPIPVYHAVFLDKHAVFSG